MESATERVLTVEQREEEREQLEAYAEELVNRVVDERLQRYTQSVMTRDEQVERVIEVYDTGQPRDSLTGQLPLLSRMTERQSSSIRDELRERSDQSVKDSVSSETKGYVTESSEGTNEISASAASSESNATHREERTSGSVKALAIVGVIFTVIVAALVILAAWLGIRKIKRKFKN